MKNNNLVAFYAQSPAQTYLDVAKNSSKIIGIEFLMDSTRPEFAFHQLYKLASPKPVNGVDYGNLQYLRKINTQEFADAQNEIIELFGDGPDDDVKDVNGIPSVEVEAFINLMTPALLPQQGESDLHKTTKQLLAIDDNFNDNIRIEPMVEVDEHDLYSSDIAPSAFLPHDSMIDSSLDDLQISDVLTIFPEAEAELLAICIGRGLVGPNGTTTTLGKHKIEHSYRTFPLVFGGPGLGKSTLFEFLFNAIEKNGYKVSNFAEMDSHFGLGEIVNSNFSYCDDLVNNSLRSLLSAPLFKQAITGSKIRAHIKFADDVEVRATTTFIANINNFDASILNSVDAGTLNRLAIISTLSSREINLKKSKGLTTNSPNLRTRENIEWLAEELGVSIEAIMLKFARLCADKFYQLTKVNKLESTVNALKRKLRVQLHEQINASFVSLLQFAYLLTTGAQSIPQINGPSLKTSLEALDALLNDAKFNNVRNIIKADWVASGSPSDHIFTALKLIDNVSISYSAALDLSVQVIKDPVKSIKAYYEAIRLDSGFNLPANIGQIKLDWQNCRSTGLADNLDLIAKCEPIEQYKLGDRNTSHVFEVGYDREALKNELNRA